MSGSTLNLALRITGDAGQLKAEIAGANTVVASLGPAAQGAAGAAVPAFNSVGAGARNAGAGVQQFAAAQQQAATATGLTSRQIQQLTPQLNDFFTQIALGQSPLMALIAQGGQITPIFGGVRATLSAFVGLLGGPFGVAAIGAAAGLAAIGLQAERQERALIANSVALRRTRDDYVSLASSVEDAAKRIGNSSAISTNDAREAGLIIAGTRRFSGDSAEVERLTRLSADLARVMGVEVPQAAERFVAKAISDPARAAREAADGGLRGFNEALVRQVQRLQASGDRAGATRIVVDELGRAAGGAASELTQVQSAWTTLTNSIKSGLETIAEASAAFILRLARSGQSGPARDYADQQASGDQSLPADVVDRASRSLLTWGGVRDALGLNGRTGQYRGGLGAARSGSVAESEALYNSVPGRPPIGSRFREPGWAADLAPATGRLWDPGVPPQEMPPASNNAGLSGRVNRALRGDDILTDAGVRNTRSDDAIIARNRIATLQGSLDSGLLDPETARRTGEAIQELRRQLVALDNPLGDVNRQLRDQARLSGIAGEGARSLAQAEIQAREAARRAGGDAGQQDAAAAEARAAAQQQLNGQLEEAVRGYGRQRESILAGVAVQREGTAAAREDQIALQARTEALKFGEEGSAAYQRAVERLTAALRGVKEAQDQASIGPLLTAQQRAAGEVERQRGLIGSSALDRAQSDAEAQALSRLRAANISTTGSVAESYIAEERRRAQNLLGVERERAAYDELGRIGESAFDRIGAAATQSALNGVKGMDLLRNTGNAVASELYQAFLKLALLNPLKNWLGGGNAPTLTDVAGRLLGGTSLSGLFGGSSAPVMASSSGVDNMAFAMGFQLHGGGRASAGTPRAIDPAWFLDAPRFHDGRIPGLAAGEIPAILRNDEFVFTPEQMGALGGRGDVNFNIDFRGDAGSAEDRARLIEGLRGVVRQEIGAASPGIVNAASAQVADLARRGGTYSRDVGRR